MPDNNKTAAEILSDVGRALNPGDDWQVRLARALGVRRDTVRQWQHGHVRFDADHGRARQPA
jgi:hypothetical protein